MESTDWEKKAGADTLASLKDRFAVQTREVMVIALVILLIGAWVVVRGNQASVGLLGRPLRVGIAPWPGFAGGLVANNGLRANRNSDFWKNHNLLVQFVIVPDEEQLRRDFAQGGERGGIDVMWSTVDSLAREFPDFEKEGIQPRAFMQVDWSRGADAIIASAGIERIEDLRGKKVATPMAASLWLLEYSLENSSLTSAEKTEIRNQRLTTKGSQEARDLFVNGSVDAAVLWEPDVTEAINRRTGANKLIDTSVAANLIADVMVAKEDFIREHPEVIAAFIRGWLLDGATKAISNPMLAVKALQEEPDFERLGEETTRGLLGKVVLATLDDNARMFGLSNDDALFRRLFKMASDIWLKHGYITAPVIAEQVQDTRPLQELYHAELLAAGAGCDSEHITQELHVVFPSGSAELSLETQRALDDNILHLLQTGPELRLCVEAVATERGKSQPVIELRKARAAKIIERIVRYNLSRSTSGTISSGKVTHYIRLKPVSAGG